MKSFVALMVVLFVGRCQSLRCFECTDCGGDDNFGQSKTCSNDEDDVCMKVVLGDHIVRKCANEDLCGLGKTERAANRAWTSITNVFKDVDEDASLVYCCDDDHCNAGMKNLPSFSIILLPLVIVAIFKY